MSDEQTKAPPKTIYGVTFRCYHIGVLRYQWRNDDGSLVIGSNASHRSTYYAMVDGAVIGNRYRRLDTAMKAAVLKSGRGRMS